MVFRRIVLASLVAVSGICSLIQAESRDQAFLHKKGDSIEFPAGFLKGVARSLYQDGGHNSWNLEEKPYSNWSAFEDSTVRFNVRGASLTGRSPIKDGQRVGDSVDGWERASDDISLLTELGCNSQRFSLEWTDIEPKEGEFNEACLDWYAQYCDELSARGITPMVTLHHFVHPQWFEEKGGFTKQENIHYFTRYAAKVFERLGSKVHLWCTINEPTVLASCGYMLGIHAPGVFCSPKRAGYVLKHLLQAHIEVYKTLKAMPYGDDAQIGIVHQMLCFEPYRYNPFGNFTFRNPVGGLVSYLFNRSFAHTNVKEFLKTGELTYNGVTFSDEDAPNCYDFIGLNFYSKVVLGFGPTQYEGQIKTDMDYAIRPDLMYDALEELSELGKPIYITETGIADEKDDRRALFITGYMNAIHQAIQDGMDVRGVFYWTLLDNFEWNDGFDMKFGLYTVDSATNNRTLRDGAKVYRDYVQVEDDSYAGWLSGYFRGLASIVS